MVPISSCLRVSAVQLRTLVQGVLLGLHIFIRAHQAPVDVFHLVHRVKNLLAEEESVMRRSFSAW